MYRKLKVDTKTDRDMHNPWTGFEIKKSRS